MADNKVKFLRGTADEYAAVEKDSDTIYFTTDDGNMYVGDKKISGGSSSDVDDTLSNTSENPVQNKVITEALNDKASKAKYSDTAINVGRKADTTVGDYSVAIGVNVEASGEYSRAEGYETKATGDYSYATGWISEATGKYSCAIGNNTQATGAGAFAGGADCQAIGGQSFVYGDNLIANHSTEVAFGEYNQSNLDTIFSIGNGGFIGEEGITRQNAFEITTDGGKLHGKDIATTDMLSSSSSSITIDSELSSTSTNPVQNKVVNAALTSHTSNTSNPHNVTKSQVGLGNVPNVATNDQAPSYTEATSLTSLTSGEKLSIAFGKIAKAITDLISHIGDSVKHITSTERTNWNSAKSHADSTHAPSDAQANVIETVKVNGTALTPSSKSVDITVPSVGNGTITITQNGTTKGTFTTNQSGNTTIELTDNNTTYSVATSSALGLVKSGTDITVDSSGNVSVNDDSHNHVISNVDGLQSALDGKADSSHTHTKSQITDLNKPLSSEDLNTIKTVGFYYAGGSNSVTNKPSGVDAFGLEVIQSANGWNTQIMYASNTVQKSYRRWFDGSSWTSWTEDELTDTKVTNTLATTTKAYVTGTTSASTNTGTQVFDTGVYLDTTAGMLTATTFKGSLSGNASTSTKLASSSNTTVTIDSSSWTTNSDGGYMYTYALPTAMPYDNFNFDVILSTDQSAAKLQIEAWNCIIADGNITQTTSDGITTAFTFYAFTTQPSVALTVGIQGVS